MALAEQSSQSDNLTNQSKAARMPSRPRVVIPLDGSPLSERATGVGESLARILDGTVELVHVVDPDRRRRNGRASATPKITYRESPRGAAYAIPVSWRVLTRKPGRATPGALQHAPRTIVAMSTHGRSGLQRFLFGSVADKVIRGVSIPVAVVRDTRESNTVDQQPARPTRWVRPRCFRAATGDVTDWRRTFLGIVRVVDMSHAHENLAIKYGSIWSDSDLLNDITVDAEREARASQEETAVRLRAAGYHVSWEVRVGPPE